MPGFQRDQAYVGAFPFEHIDTGSGNLLLTFTDFSLPGYNGMDLVFQRTFNSANQGWTSGLAGFPMRVARPDGPPRPPDRPPDFQNPEGLPLIITADGAAHRTWWEGSDYNATAQIFRTADFWRYHTDGRRLELPNGVECYYDDHGYLVEVRDRFSNRIEIVNETYAGGIDGRRPTEITQRLGDGRSRTLTLGYQFVTTESSTSSILTTATSAGRTWTYQYGGLRGLDLVAAIPPVGPRWSFDHQHGLDVSPRLTVTLPQGGQLVYAFVDAPAGTEQYGALRNRKTRVGGTDTSEWTFEFEPESPTSFNYRRVLLGPESVRLVYGYEPGAAEGGSHVLRWREVWNTATNTRLEREDRTYATTAVTATTGQVRNLLYSVTVERDGHTYTTTLSYHPGNSGGRFADYGRPWSIREDGDGGIRYRVRDFDYEFTGYQIDKIKSETVTVGTESNTRSWEYVNETGFPLSATRYGITTTYNPDPSTGTIAEMIDAHGHHTAFTYDWGVLKNTTTPQYAITREINADGTVASETRRGFVSQYEYDAVGRLVLVKPPVGRWIETQYDNAAARWTKTLRGNGADFGSWTRTDLDAFGRIVGTENSVGVRTRVAYDSVGRTSYESLPFDAVTPEAGQSLTYDALNRVTRVTRGDGAVAYAYVNGVDVRITDEENRETLQDWAAVGDPSQARLVGVTDADGQAWSYAYNGLGALTQVTQPGGLTRRWEYTGELLTKEVHPESGETTYSYDSAGRLAFKQDARSLFAYGYDANDRVTSIDGPGTVHDLAFAYDAADNRTLVQNSVVRCTFQYDGANRLEWRKDTIAGQPERQTSFDYDDWDNVWHLTYPSGHVVRYEHDRESRISGVFREPGGVAVAQVLAYHPSGAVKTLRYGNGIEETLAFDAQRQWLTGIAGGPLTATYGHDRVGNVTSVADARPGYNQAFTYDALDRVRFVTGLGANEYQYDALGNRMAKANPAVTYAYDPTTKRLSTVTGNVQFPEVGAYGYDDAGNLTSDRNGTYTYTPFNMLETATVAGQLTTYRYDGANLRTARITSVGTDFFFHGANDVLSEFTQPSGAPQAFWMRDYIYLGSRLVASVRASTSAAFTQASSSGLEGTSHTVTVVLQTTLPLTAPLTVSYATVPGTAGAGTDYTAISGTLTFPAGSTGGATQTLTIPLPRDRVFDPNETFTIELRDSTTNAVVATHQVTITDVPVLPGDLDNDGYRDLVWQHYGDGRLSAWSMSGTTRLNAFALDPAQITDPNWRMVGSADVNHDGHMDLYWQHETTGELVVWLMEGSRWVSSAWLTPRAPANDPNHQWKVRTVADLDGDGEPDLVWQHTGTGDVARWLMNGVTLRPNGGWVIGDGPVTDLAWTIVGAGDANRDGSVDLYWHHRTTGAAAVWFMAGAALLRGQSFPGAADTTWQMRGVGDLNGDGVPDLLWQHTVARPAAPPLEAGYEVGAWLMTGTDGLTLIEGKMLTPDVVPEAGWTIVGPK